MSGGGHQEVVMLFDARSDICAEMPLAAFEQMLGGERRLDSLAASLVCAAYCVVGSALSLRAVVFFQFSVNEDGCVDSSFNLPLRYLAQQAGKGEDLGQGPIRKASRGHCPVPWHSVNLWEPAADKGAQSVQARLYRNKLKLDAAAACNDEEFFPSDDGSIDLVEFDESFNEQIDDAGLLDEPVNRPTNDPLDDSATPESAATKSPANTNGREPTVDQRQVLTQKLTEALGETGKLSLQDIIRLHAEQLEQAKTRYREDVETQQTSYLDQIKACRSEIHELKVALRQEQGRNRRLQQMLRGGL
jgi:hypothetical protein